MPKWLLLGMLMAPQVVGPLVAEAQAEAPLPEASELLGKVDKNLLFETRTTTIKMVVDNGKRVREFQIVSYGQGADESAMEYLSPSRDKGTKMLRKGDELWMYLPSVERTQKISGHMLRQGMMGSDMSYEDMMASTSLRDMYDAKVVAIESIDGRPCYKIEMNAKDGTVTYPKRVSWVDQELHIPLRQELYALSGMILKEWRMGGVTAFEGGRQFLTWMEVSDKLQAGSKTRLEFSEIKFGVDLPTEVFSQRWLERK